MEQWIIEECRGADLRDKRLRKRLEVILQHFFESPMVSIPANNREWKDILGAYRFMSNENVSYEQILEGSRQAINGRLDGQDVLLVVQDTTSIDLTGHRASDELGYLENKKCRGIFLHPSLVITPERVNLGILNAEMWTRNNSEFGKKHTRKSRPIEEKESNYWLESYREADELAHEHPEKTIVSVGDRESDIFELLVLATDDSSKAQLLVRAAQNRRLANEETLKLWEAVESTKELGTKKVVLPKTESTDLSPVELSVKSSKLTIKAPARPGAKLRNISINAVLATEKNPKAGRDKIEWLLLTTLDVSSAKDAMQILEYYSCRWQIEMFFRVLKGGCKIEELQLETVDRLENAIACYMITSWRIQYLLMLGRQVPDMPADIYFSEHEISVVKMISKLRDTGKSPTINQMIVSIAKYGGYINRKKDGPPGLKTLWIGLSKLANYVFMYDFMKNNKDVYN